MSAERPHLLVILGSTREGRKSEMVGRWFMGVADARDDLTAELVDLRDWELPFFSFPKPPGAGGYADELQIRWGEKVASADGFVLVTPEYNHGYSAVLKNALDFVFAEWGRKPVGYVSYGGPGGGLRAVQQLRQVAVELKQVPLPGGVSFHRVSAAFGEDGQPVEAYPAKSAGALLDELAWWGRTLASARAAPRAPTA